MEQRDKALTDLDVERGRLKRLAESFSQLQQQTGEEKRAAASKVSAAREELGKEREKRIQHRDQLAEVQKELKGTETTLSAEVRKANEEIARGVARSLGLAMARLTSQAARTHAVAGIGCLSQLGSHSPAHRIAGRPRQDFTAVTSVGRAGQGPSSTRAVSSAIAELPFAELILASTCSANSQIRKQEQTIRGLETRLSDAERELQVKTNEALLLRTTAEQQAKAESAATISALRDEIRQQGDELELLRVQIEGYEKSLADTQAQLDFAGDLAHTKSKEASQLCTDVEILQAQVATQTNKATAIAELSARHSALAKNHAALQEESSETIKTMKEALEDQKKEVEK